MKQMTDFPATERNIKQPIILVGCPRSGTSLLGRLFAAHPDVAYWKEPRMIWNTGNQNLPDDVLTENNITTRVATEIDQRFATFLKQNSKTRFAEKTPSNMLRLRFIHALYPDCFIIHIHRDPRPVVASALRKLVVPPKLKRVIVRAREARLSDWPGLIQLFFRDAIGRLFHGGKKSFWGPRPAGWKEWRPLSPVTMLSKQWLALMETARHDLQQLPADSWMEICYEDLLRDHKRIVPELLKFTELEPSNEVNDLADEIIHPERADDWRQTLSPELQREIEKETAPHDS